MKRIHLIRSKNSQSGFALVTALIMLCVGSIVIMPLLSYVGTGLKATEVREDRTQEFYAEDAGIQDALNKISQDYSYGGFDLPQDFGDTVSYTLDKMVNNKLVDITVENVWPLDGLEPVPASVPGSDTITVTGTTSDSEISGQRSYAIDLVCLRDALKTTPISEVAVWLPAGFTYVSGSTEGFTTANPTQIAHHGGSVLAWDLHDVEFIDLPIAGGGEAPTAVPVQRSMAFRFTPDKDPVGAFCFMKTSTGDFYWDTETSIYKIVSEATDPLTSEISQTEAYVGRGRLKDRLAVAHGDYRAIGNSLMIDTNHDHQGIRDKLLSSSSSSIWKKASPSDFDLPSDAKVVLAYLYWSGWRKHDSQPFTDVKLGIENVTSDPGNTHWSYPASNKKSVVENKKSEYSYACRADVTSQLSLITEETGQAQFKITLGDAHPSDDDKFGELNDDWSFAGWSIIIIYSSPSEQAHRVYLYDDFRYVGNAAPQNSGLFNLIGFEAPSDSEGYLTYFVGEGDDCWKPEYLKLNGVKLYDAQNPADNIMNGISSATGANYDGVDIDTYDISHLIHEGDTSATIEYYSNRDIWNLVYTVVSFRSNLTESFEGYPVSIFSYQ